MNWKASWYIRAMTGLAVIAAATAAGNWRSEDPALFSICMILTALATCWKIQIPGSEANISAGFVFLLIAMGQFHLNETVVLAAISGLAQSLFRKKTPPRAIQVIFNTATLMVAATGVHWTVNAVASGGGPYSVLLRLTLGGVLMFLANSLALAVLFFLMGHSRIGDALRQIQMPVAPYYAIGGLIAAAVVEANFWASAWMGLSMLPLLTLAHSYFRSVLLSCGGITVRR